MSDTDVQDRVIEVFADVMDIEADSVSPETVADDIPAWDSVSHVRLIMSIEMSLGIAFTDAEIGSFQTLGDIVVAARAKV